jgi:hypothetical protein
MTALNWQKGAARERMRQHSTESMNGERSAPRGVGQSKEPAPRRTSRLPQAIEVDKFWRDRSGRAVVTRLTEYNGHLLVDIRTFFTAPEDGTMRPAKGFACNVCLLPQLARSIDKAMTEARRLGFLPDTEAGHE